MKTLFCKLPLRSLTGLQRGLGFRVLGSRVWNLGISSSVRTTRNLASNSVSGLARDKPSIVGCAATFGAVKFWRSMLCAVEVVNSTKPFRSCIQSRACDLPSPV